MKDFENYLKLWNESADEHCMPLSNRELNNGIKTISDEVYLIKKQLRQDGYIKANVAGDYELTEKSLVIWKTLNHKKEVKSKSFSTGHQWDSFRNLLTYYIECVKQEERPSHLFYPDNENKTYFLPKSLSSSWLRELSIEREKYELNVTFDNNNRNAINHFKSKYDEDNVIYLGYPILATKSKAGNLINYPVGLIPLNIKLESDDIIKSTSDTISFDVNCSEATINYALLDYYVPQERRKGFLYTLQHTHRKDDYVGLFDLYRSLADIESEFGNKEVDDKLDPLWLSQFIAKNIAPGEHKLCNTVALYTVTDLRFTKVLAAELKHIRDDVADSDLDKTALAFVYRNRILERTQVDNRVGINFIESNSEQLSGLEHAINHSCTKITGPPGTGKSQVATNIIANSIFYGDSVLFASKNHKAVNAIRERTDSLFKEIDDSLYLTEFSHDEQRVLNNPWYKKDSENTIALKSVNEFYNDCLYKVEFSLNSVSSYKALISNEQKALKNYCNCYNEKNQLNSIISQALFLDQMGEYR